MLELGQPNHPYDLAKVRGSGFRVRRARDGETLVTLDDVERRFIEDDLLICDGDDRPIGIAGVMGGADTEIDDATTDVLLEMAWFHPISVAKTSRRLGLRSEASARFEKGTDPEIIDLAHRPLRRAARRQRRPPRARHGRRPGRAARPHAGAGAHGAGQPAARHRARRRRRSPSCSSPSASPATVEGDDTDVIDPVVAARLRPSRSTSSRRSPARTATPPSAGACRVAARAGLTPRQRDRRRLASLLSARGLAEAMPMAFLAPGDLERPASPATASTITNPLVAEESVLRTSLLPGLLKSLANNAARRNTGVGLFEIGHVFRRPADGEQAGRCPTSASTSPSARAERDARAAVQTWWAAGRAPRRADGVDRQRPRPGAAPDPVGGARRRGRGQVGAVGEVDPRVLDAYGIGERVAWLEVDLGRCSPRCHGTRHVYRPFSRSRRATSTSPSRSSDAVPAAAWRPRIDRAAGELPGGAAPLRRLPRPRSPTAAAAWPTPSGSRPPTAPSPTPRSARRGGAASTAVEGALPATLRG